MGAARETVIIRMEKRERERLPPLALITLIRFPGTLKNIKMIWKIILDRC